MWRAKRLAVSSDARRRFESGRTPYTIPSCKLALRLGDRRLEPQVAPGFAKGPWECRGRSGPEFSLRTAQSLQTWRLGRFSPKVRTKENGRFPSDGSHGGWKPECPISRVWRRTSRSNAQRSEPPLREEGARRQEAAEPAIAVACPALPIRVRPSPRPTTIPGSGSRRWRACRRDRPSPELRRENGRGETEKPIVPTSKYQPDPRKHGRTPRVAAPAAKRRMDLEGRLEQAQRFESSAPSFYAECSRASCCAVVDAGNHFRPNPRLASLFLAADVHGRPSPFERLIRGLIRGRHGQNRYK